MEWLVNQLPVLIAGREETAMKHDPVIRLIALLALIQVLAFVPLRSEKSTFYAVTPEMIQVQASSGGKIEPLTKADTTVYVRLDLLHKEKAHWAGANILILGLAALYRWRKLTQQKT